MLWAEEECGAERSSSCQFRRLLWPPVFPKVAFQSQRGRIGMFSAHQDERPLPLGARAHRPFAVIQSAFVPHRFMGCNPFSGLLSEVALAVGAAMSLLFFTGCSRDNWALATMSHRQGSPSWRSRQASATTWTGPYCGVDIALCHLPGHRLHFLQPGVADFFAEQMVLCESVMWARDQWKLTTALVSDTNNKLHRCLMVLLLTLTIFMFSSSYEAVIRTRFITLALASIVGFALLTAFSCLSPGFRSLV